jgi:hypothetical protein
MSDALLVFLGGLIGSLPGIYAIIAGRKKALAEASKTDAEASQIVSDTAMKMIQPLQAQIDRLEAKVAKVESNNEVLMRQVHEFRDLIRDLWQGVLILAKQLESRGTPLAWSVQKYRQAVEKALGESEDK